MIRTTMEHKEAGLYLAALYDDDTLIAESSEPLPFSQAMRWIGRATADYVGAQLTVARHNEGPA